MKRALVFVLLLALMAGLAVPFAASAEEDSGAGRYERLPAGIHRYPYYRAAAVLSARSGASARRYDECHPPQEQKGR